ncbi:MAG: hypothetical protein V4757_15260 [Pseudomonadota bacterium]
MSALEFRTEDRNTRRDSRESGKPQQRQLQERTLRADGFATHDAFNPPQRRPGLAILDYEEGESI